jgi:hypothetical protein
MLVHGHIQRGRATSELDLAQWCRSLIPIIEHFAQAAEGDADVAFWRRIYNPIDAYGGLVITDGSRACIRISSARPPSPRQIQCSICRSTSRAIERRQTAGTPVPA